MDNYYILSINSQADYEWDRCVLRNPITGQRPDLTQAVAQRLACSETAQRLACSETTQCLACGETAESIGKQPGSHLVKVSINVEILETVPQVSESIVNSSLHQVSKLPTAI